MIRETSCFVQRRVRTVAPAGGLLDLYLSTGDRRTPRSTSHRPRRFTLRDLVSFDRSTTRQRGEQPCRLEPHRSWNCGVRGRDRRPGAALRPAAANLARPLALPTATDDHRRRRTRPAARGNNNPYAQDNEISLVTGAPTTRAGPLRSLARHSGSGASTRRCGSALSMAAAIVGGPILAVPSHRAEIAGRLAGPAPPWSACSSP